MVRGRGSAAIWRHERIAPYRSSMADGEHPPRCAPRLWMAACAAGSNVE
jgi:hypothetical protein